MQRYCNYCGNEIKECMGGVSARDFIAYMGIKRKIVREHCGRCVLTIEEFCSRNNISLEDCLNYLLKE